MFECYTNYVTIMLNCLSSIFFFLTNKESGIRRKSHYNQLQPRSIVVSTRTKRKLSVKIDVRVVANQLTLNVKEKELEGAKVVAG